MSLRDFESDFEEIGERVIGEDGLVHIQFEAVKDETMCPCCKGTNISRYGYRFKKGFKEITAEGETVVLSLKLRRYACADCSAQKAAESGTESIFTFSTTLPDCVPKQGNVSEHLVDAVVQRIATERIFVEEAAQEFHVSQSTVSEMINQRGEAAWNEMKTCCVADTLLIYPFYYGAKKDGKKRIECERCAILGVLGDRPMLYALLKDGKDETILKWLKKVKVEEAIVLKTLLTDYPRPTLYRGLPQTYPGAELGILRTCTFRRTERIYKKCTRLKRKNQLEYDVLALRRVFSFHCYDPINDEFMPMDLDDESIDEYLDEFSNHSFEEMAAENFNTILEAWENNLSAAAKDCLPIQVLCNDFKEHKDRLTKGILYAQERYDPARLLRVIDSCRENKVPFENLQNWLALVAGVHNKENVTAVQMLSSSYVPQSLHGVYIDLNELNALMDA